VPFRLYDAFSLEHAIKALALDGTATKRGSHITLEAFPVLLEVFSSLLIQRIRRVRLEEEELYLLALLSHPSYPSATYLQANNHRIQVQHRLPVLSQNI
jgi:hypothetical protein